MLKKLEKITIETILNGMIGIGILIFTYLLLGIGNEKIAGNSMDPNFTNRESVWTLKRFINYDRCDVVVLVGEKINFGKDKFIKRIIGIPGDKILISNGSININNKNIDENKFVSTSSNIQDNFNLELKSGEYFVLGDNRLHSEDSRKFGIVDKGYFSKVLKSNGKSECLDAYKGVSKNNGLQVAQKQLYFVFGSVILVILLTLILIFWKSIKKVISTQNLLTILKIIISTFILWFVIMTSLSVIVRILWFFKLTPVQTNSGNVNEMINEQENVFKKYDK